MQTEYKGQLDEQGSLYLNFIQQCTQRMQHLVSGLLSYALVGREERREMVDCRKLMAEVIQDLAAAIQESGAEITVETLPVVEAYPVELRSLLQNLLSNALKFRQREVHPQITIRARQEENFWRFEVQDNGIGIDHRHINKLFVIFRRLHNHNEYQGTGIGLALCKKIVDLHGGEITVQSAPGEGSTFIFTLSR
jgi:light-regulated signal transduction histidine kinase (bacteriophytochrome)